MKIKRPVRECSVNYEWKFGKKVKWEKRRSKIINIDLYKNYESSSSWQKGTYQKKLLLSWKSYSIPEEKSKSVSAAQSTLTTTSYAQTARFWFMTVNELYTGTSSSTIQFEVDSGTYDNLINLEDLAKDFSN